MPHTNTQLCCTHLFQPVVDCVTIVLSSVRLQTEVSAHCMVGSGAGAQLLCHDNIMH